MNILSYSVGALALTSLALVTPPAETSAGPTVTVTITNLTANQIFSPPIVVAHREGTGLFDPGTAATPELAQLAENGDNLPLTSLLMSDPLTVDLVAAKSGILPGQSASFTLTVGGRPAQLSAAGMLVSSNDAFFGLDSIEVPKMKKGAVTVYAPAFDAGSEANSENCAFVPGPPCDAGPVHDPAPAEGFVHVGNGIRGIGGVPAGVYDWKNPVAQIVIERN